MSRAYYNDVDPDVCAWLRNLIDAGLIAPGDVDQRSIADVTPDDLRGYTQCHFFAGIGVWSYALRLADWSDDRPVWTGSCPCQPFSAAGKRQEFADDRHLWPAWGRLIAECRPVVVFGEQVAGPAGERWLDLVHDDLEAVGYAVGATVLPAASVGAPHGRHRLFFVADAERGTAERYGFDVGDATRGDQGAAEERQRVWTDASDGSVADALADADGERCEGQRLHVLAGAPRPSVPEVAGGGVTRGFWSAADWLPCRDGKWRPVEPGTFPLAHGASARMVKLRAYGNAIVPQVAEAFIRAYRGG